MHAKVYNVCYFGAAFQCSAHLDFSELLSKDGVPTAEQDSEMMFKPWRLAARLQCRLEV